MKKFFTRMLRYKKAIIILYVILLAFSVLCNRMVKINTDLSTYLPKDSGSTVSLELMKEEFGGDISNAKLMVRDITIPKAVQLKGQLRKIDGVLDVKTVDDAVDTTEPLEFLDQEQLESYYKENCALFMLTLDGEKKIKAMEAIRDLAGEHIALSGSAIEGAVAAESSKKELAVTIAIALVFCLGILLITTTAWFEPILLLSSIGAAILLNMGSNIIFGEISTVTSTAASILQLGVSIDYSIFLLHRFEEYREEGLGIEESMVNALKNSLASIASSGVTTVIGFAALILMRYRIGADMGWVMSKGILISMISVFTLLPCITVISYKWLDKTKHKPLVPKLNVLADWIYRLRVPMVLLFVIVSVPFYIAQTQNTFYYGSSHLYSEETESGKEKVEIDELFGTTNALVIMVPKGDKASEESLGAELKQHERVISVTSFSEQVGNEIPEEYLKQSIKEQLSSDSYSRMIVSIRCPAESEETFQAITEIKEIAQKFYPDQYYLAGDSVSTFDLKDVITSDNLIVNLIAIGAVLIVLILAFRGISVPIILVLSIETAIWINLGIPYFTGEVLFFIGYLIISSVQLGATVDYAILMTSRYQEKRQDNDRLTSMKQAIQLSGLSIITSASVMAVAGALLALMCSNQLIAQLGKLLARGTIFSALIVFFVLPPLLYFLDGVKNKMTRSEKANEENN